MLGTLTNANKENFKQNGKTYDFMVEESSGFQRNSKKIMVWIRYGPHTLVSHSGATEQAHLCKRFKWKTRTSHRPFIFIHLSLIFKMSRENINILNYEHHVCQNKTLTTGTTGHKYK